MLDGRDKQRLQKLLSDTIPLLCKRTLGFSSEVSVEALIGITVSGEDAANKEVVMVSFKETVMADGRVSSYVWSEMPSIADNVPPTPLVGPVAFNVSTSNSSCDLKPSSLPDLASTIDTSICVMEGCHSEYSSNWEDGHFWEQSGSAEFHSDDENAGSALDLTRTSPSSLTVKLEETDYVKHEDFPVEFQASDDLENMSDLARAYDLDRTNNNHRSSSSSVPDSCLNLSVRQNGPAVGSEALMQSSKGQRNTKAPGCGKEMLYRKLAHAAHSGRSAHGQHCPPSADGRPQVKIKKTPYATVKSTVQSNYSEPREPFPQCPMADGLHRPVPIAPTTMQATPKKRCRVCYAAKRRREVRYCCGSCPEQPGLCLDPCFEKFHRTMV